MLVGLSQANKGQCRHKDQCRLIQANESSDVSTGQQKVTGMGPGMILLYFYSFLHLTYHN